jgi:hypothetical protein
VSDFVFCLLLDASNANASGAFGNSACALTAKFSANSVVKRIIDIPNSPDKPTAGSWFPDLTLQG